MGSKSRIVSFTSSIKMITNLNGFVLNSFHKKLKLDLFQNFLWFPLYINTLTKSILSKCTDIKLIRKKTWLSQFFWHTLVDRKSFSWKILQDSCKSRKFARFSQKNSFLARFLDAMAFLQDSWIQWHSCKIRGCNGILARFVDAMAFLQDSCKNLARIS